MLRSELIAALTLAGVYFLRMLGLFVVLPAYALHATDLDGATASLIGVAVGAYGATQALLQIPFGRWSDRYGRKPVIVGGLLIFILGSLIAAVASDIYTSIVGRSLQGAGAISGAIMALAADLTRAEVRTRVMALIGVSIGIAFATAFVIGPMIASAAGLSGLFGLSALLGVGAILLMLLAVPKPAEAPQVTLEGNDALWRALSDASLLRLDLGIFCLHGLLTATFVVLPLLMRDQAGLSADQHWQLYLPALVISIGAVMPLVRYADNPRLANRLQLACILGLALVELALAAYPGGMALMAALLLGFFLCFNLLEASLPAQISKAAPPEIRGTALGVYASCQFVGTFAGGVLAGLAHEHLGLYAVFILNAALALVWAANRSPVAPATHSLSERTEAPRGPPAS